MELERIVGKLLTKEADYRYQTAADLISDLKSVDVTGSGLSRRAFQTSAGTTLQAGTAVAAGPKAVLPKWAWAVAASLLLIFGAALGRWLAPGQSPADRPTMHVRLEVPGFEAINHPTLSADGRYLAFTADAPQGRTLVIHDLSTNESSIIADVQDEPRLARFSPDGSWLVYERGELGLGIVQVPGGIPAALSEVGTNPTWLDSETIAFNHTGSIAVIDRISHEVTILYEGQVGTLNALAGGGQILAGLFDPGMPQFGVFDVGKASMTVLGAGMAPRFVPPGHILFQRGDESAGPTDPGPLYVQAYDVANKRLLGSAVEVLDAQESWRLDVSTGGHLVVLPTDANSSPMVVLARLDPTTGSSRPLEWAAPMSDFNGFGLSGDGRWIAYAGNGRAPSINVREIDRPQASPVTLTTREYAWNFRLSTDGSTVWYSQGGPQTTPQVWRQSAEGSGGASVQFDGQPSLLGDVSPDARFWALTNSDGGIRWNFGGLRFVDAVEGTETRVDTTWRVRWGAGRFSPDYRFFAFDGSGASEGAGSFVIGRDGSGPWRVGDMGGPKWSRDGRALFLHRDDSIVRIDLDFSRGVRPSATETIVFESPGLAGFEVLPDGDLLVVTGPGGDRSGRLDLVLDWGRRLEEIAPSR